jgi:hypothetical protein
LAAGAAGIISGCLFFNLLERSRKRQNNVSLTKMRNIIKQNLLEKDAPAVLFESHSNKLPKNKEGQLPRNTHTGQATK